MGSRRHLLTYEEAEICTGIQRQSLGQFLDPIAEYCLGQGLPPITILVVKKDTGVPGSGFRAHEINTAEKFAQALATVFLEDWNKRSPKLEDLGPAKVNSAHAKANSARTGLS